MNKAEFSIIKSDAITRKPMKYQNFLATVETLIIKICLTSKPSITIACGANIIIIETRSEIISPSD